MHYSMKGKGVGLNGVEDCSTFGWYVSAMDNNFKGGELAGAIIQESLSKLKHTINSSRHKGL